jgi:DNA (cytosine-5)-methyltransferase 1
MVPTKPGTYRTTKGIVTGADSLPHYLGRTPHIRHRLRWTPLSRKTLPDGCLHVLVLHRILNLQTRSMNELALFAGAGGGILGGKLLGWRTVCAVEWDAYARDVLVARQNDGCLEAFPIWDDVQTFDGYPWRGCVNVVSGGFPCQDISAAGKGAGIEGSRSGMWQHMARIIGEVLPQFVFVENSPLLVSRGLGLVLSDLAKMGYDARWGVVGAHNAGAPHKRDRIWIVAHANTNLQSRSSEPRQQLERPSQSGGSGESNVVPWKDVADALRYRSTTRATNPTEWQERNAGESDNSGENVDNAVCGRCEPPQEQICAGRNCTELPSWWSTEPDVGRVAHGVAARVDRLRCIGNGQVSAVVPIAWQTLGVTEMENATSSATGGANQN